MLHDLLKGYSLLLILLEVGPVSLHLLSILKQALVDEHSDGEIGHHHSTCVNVCCLVLTICLICSLACSVEVNDALVSNIDTELRVAIGTVLVHPFEVRFNRIEFLIYLTVNEVRLTH